MSAVLGSRHLMNFWCQVFLLLLSQGVEVPSFQPFLKETSCILRLSHVCGFLDLKKHISCSRVYQKIPKPSISGPFLSLIFHCLLRRFHNHQVWTVRPTVAVLAMPPQSIHAAWPERNSLPPNGPTWGVKWSEGILKLNWYQEVKRGGCQAIKNSHSTHIFLELRVSVLQVEFFQPRIFFCSSYIIKPRCCQPQVNCFPLEFAYKKAHFTQVEANT